MKLGYAKAPDPMSSIRRKLVRSAFLDIWLLLWLLPVSLFALPDRASLLSVDGFQSPGGTIYPVSMMNDGIYVSRRLAGQNFILSMSKTSLYPVIGGNSLLLAVMVGVWFTDRRPI